MSRDFYGNNFGGYVCYRDMRRINNYLDERKISWPIVVALLVLAGIIALPVAASADSSEDYGVEAPLPDETVIEQELHPEKYRGPKEEAVDTLWHADILPGYEARSVNLGKSFDGPVVCTVVRKLGGGHKGVLYVHGFNDYFFQSEMGDKYLEQGINFYAVDLRRYGRSLRPWQYPFNVRNMEEYFEDIDAALTIMRKEGMTDITLAGHSTGGLTVSLYAALRGARCGVRRVVTDSPFLQWNFNKFYRSVLLPSVTLWGALSPNTKIPQGDCDAYSHSLLKQYHGEWEYDTNWKMIYSPPVTASWVRAISRGQSKLMRNRKNIVVPILVMHSSKGLHECGWTPACMEADIVLDPEQLQERGEKLGSNPDVVTIEDGIHDLILSREHVRDAAYDTIFQFIRNNP